MTAREQPLVMIGVDRLKAGWVADRDIFHGVDLLIKAGVTLSQAMIDGLRKRGFTQITIAADSDLADLTVRPVTDPLADLLNSSNSIYAAHGLELAIPETLLEEATDQIEGFFQQLEFGQPVDLSEARQTVHTIVSTFLKRSNLAIKLLDLDHFDRYTYRHSINVGLLFLHIASQWIDNEAVLEELTYGAVLHDIGKAKVGSDIINKPGKLTPEEWTTMKSHPVWSAEMLEPTGASPDAISLARSHHERLDGTGYPDGLRGPQLSRLVRLLAICDVYDALTTKRSYKKKMEFVRAIDLILQNCGTHFDAEVAHQFIRRVGRYPAGTFVQLSDGDLAVVVQVNEQAISRPVVSRVANRQGEQHAQVEQVDLSQRLDLYISRIVVQHELTERSQPG